MLMVLAMILTMLPAAVAADDVITAIPLSDIPTDGQSVVIYSASAGGVFAGTASGGSVGVSTAQTYEENDNLGVREGAGVYKLVANTDGTYYITCGGKYLFTDSSEQLAFKDTAEMGTKWKIQKADGFDGYVFINNDFKYGNYDIYIEYYSSFKAWTCREVSDIYCFEFYAIDGSADADGDGYLGQKPEAGEMPADGDKVVIYNHSSEACFGPEDTGSLAPIFSSVDEAGNLNPGNGALIFNVSYDGSKYYTFEINGKYLWTNEEEELMFVDTQDDYTKWYLEEATGGYIMYNKAAKYNNRPVCIEYFGNAFSGWTYNGSESIFAMKFFKVEDPHGLGYVLNPSMAIDAGNAYLGIDYEFEVVLDDSTKIESMKMTYQTNGGSEVAIEPKSVDGYTYVYAVPASALAGKTSMTLKGAAKNEYNMEYSAQADVLIYDEPLIVSVSPMSNSATGDEKKPEIVVDIANCGNNPTVLMTVDGVTVSPKVTDDKITYKPTEKMVDARHSVAVTIIRADGKKAEMTWSFFVGEEGLSLYFGQMHSHTAQYSDGAGTLEQAYEYAMNAEDVDFLFVTDHSNYFDTTKTATTTSYYDLSSLEKVGDITKWEEAKATATEYIRDDFLGMYGYEMTWSGGPGHTNTFNTYGTVSRNNAALNDKTNSYAGMHLYNDLMVNANLGLDVDGNPVGEGVKTKYIEEAPVVSQFNHPGTTFGNFDDFAGYTPNRDTVLSLVEVGNGEGAVGGSSYWPSYSQYDLCLSKGWHVAPTNNQDNHKGKWGDANTCRDVVLTDDFSEVGIYNAMSNRQVYATEDQNLRIYYYLNEHLMGSIIDIGDEEVKKVNITASIADPDGEALGVIEIIGENGITLKSYEAAGATYELDVEINNTDAYYYLKITQKDGDIAVTAPVWVGVATPITADIEYSSALCVKGEKLPITSTVTNAATEAYELSKVEFYLVTGSGEDVKEKKIETIKEDVTIAAGESKTFNFDYKLTVLEDQTIKVVYTGKYNGKNFKCQASFDLYVWDPGKLINVAIDRGHDNYYISGDYADNIGNFITYCANNGIRCNYIEKGEFTYNTLKEYDLVILTVPYLRNTAKANMYTAEELEAIGKYADKGGNLIVCSKSDRDNTFDNCSENTNAILEAVGAHTRVVNGIIVDNDLKANEAYRLYFSAKENFNTEHRFTKGAYTASNAFNTRPATDNQTGFQVYNGAPIEIMDGYEDDVEVLVRGYQSTWGSHYDGYFDSGAFIPEYAPDDPSKVTVRMDEVNIMTYEELTKKDNWIVTCGVTFFSNYDIKDDVNYANKYIVQNILREMTSKRDKEEKATPITTVKAQSEGRFAIEGYVSSNASGYDQDTAFFDCIYVQDKNGNGINVFPVAGNFAVGMNVRCYGAVTFYCGEVELNLSSDFGGSIRIVSDDIFEVVPKTVTCKTAMSDEAIGNLMKVSGIVTGIHKTEGVIDKIYVRDTTGEACIFINGYIMKDYTGIDNLSVGMTVSAIGVGSRDVDETSATSAIFARLRVRDRSEVVIINSNIDIDGVFTDVAKKDWFFDSVEYCVTNSLLTGTGNGLFQPNTTLNRAMVATVLYRLAGEPDVSIKTNFTDIAEGQWYTDAVVWAQSNAIVTGYEDNTFRPNASITRQEMAVMIARYAKNIAEIDTTPSSKKINFPDAASVASWAKDAVAWCIENEIINGMDGKVAPNGVATRAQFATIIMRFDKLNQPEAE